MSPTEQGKSIFQKSYHADEEASPKHFWVCYLRFGSDKSEEISLNAESKEDAERQVKNKFPNDPFPPFTMSIGPL